MHDAGWRSPWGRGRRYPAAGYCFVIRVHQYNIGDTITVGKTNDSTIRGTYSGMYTYSDAEYVARYKSARAIRDGGTIGQSTVDTTRFPAMGEPLNMTITAGRDTTHRHGHFHDFDKTSLGIITSSPPYNLLHYAFPEIADIRNDAGRTFDRTAMEGAITRGEVPIRTAVLVKERENMVTIPGEQVRFGYMPHLRHPTAAGMLIVLTIDTIILAIMLSTNPHAFSVGG